MLRPDANLLLTLNADSSCGAAVVGLGSQELNSREEFHMATRYGKKAASKVERAMHERKVGTLRSGRSGRKVTSRKQAIAIGLSEARKEGAKVPRKRSFRGARKKK
jgi:hypothetical protein